MSKFRVGQRVRIVKQGPKSMKKYGCVLNEEAVITDRSPLDIRGEWVIQVLKTGEFFDCASFHIEPITNTDTWAKEWVKKVTQIPVVA